MGRSATPRHPAPALDPRWEPTLTPSKIRRLFERFEAADPSPKTELDYTSPYTLVVAVALSAQATDVSVNKATARLFSLADTPTAMVALGLDQITDLIRTIGLFRNKAKNLVATCRILVDQHGGQVPRSREALEALPGVGRKTANVVLNVAFGEATMAVDTHVFRVSNRTGLAPGRNPLEVESKLLQRIPPRYLVDAHHWLILHGRYLCLARSPRCTVCAVRPWCDMGASTIGPAREKR